MPTNLSAFLLALEIAEWDRLRSVLSVAGERPIAEDTTFLDDGMYCYHSFLAVLHGEALRSDHGAYKKWRRYSRKHRKQLAKDGAPIDGGKDVEATDDRLERLNRLAPDESYSSPEAMDELRRELAEVEDTA